VRGAPFLRWPYPPPVAETDRIAAVVDGCDGEVGRRAQSPAFEVRLVAEGQEVVECVGHAVIQVAAGVVVRAVRAHLTLETALVLFPDILEAPDAVLSCEVPVSLKQAQRHERIVVLANLPGRAAFHGEQGYRLAPAEGEVAPQDLVDDTAVIVGEEGIVVEEVPHEGHLPVEEVHVRPGFGYPAAGRFGPLVQEMHEVPEMPGPPPVARKEIVHSPGRRVAVIDARVPDVPAYRVEDMFDALRRRGQCVRGFEVVENAYITGAVAEKSEKGFERPGTVLVPARADHDNVTPWIPYRGGRMNDHAAFPGEKGIGEGVPAHVQLEGGRAVHDVPDDDEVTVCEVGLGRPVRADERYGFAAFPRESGPEFIDTGFHAGGIDHGEFVPVEGNGENARFRLSGKGAGDELVVDVIGRYRK